MMKEYFPVLFQGSKYAVRDVIGDMNVIRNFRYETLRNFYHDWYRTDLQAIAIVGDFDVDEMEQKVKALFSKLEAVENPPKRESFEVPAHQDLLFVVATDKEADKYSVNLNIKHKALPVSEKNLNYLRDKYIMSLFNMMSHDRISELLQKGTPPFISGNISYSEFVPGYEVFSVSAMAKPDQEDLALKALYAEAQRICKHGFTQSELNRAKINMLTSIESRYKQRDKINNDEYAYNIKENYIKGEPLTSIEFDWEFVQKVLPTISVEEISAQVNKWITAENRVIVVKGPDKPTAKHLSKEQALALLAEVENSTLQPYTEQVVSTDLIGNNLSGSISVKTKRLPEFDAVEWTLGNKCKVVFRKADFDKDQVELIASSKGGNSKIKDDYLASAKMLTQFIGSFGVNNYDNSTLKKALSGKNASVYVDLSELDETIYGTSTPKDFETMMQLLYLQFEKPRFDKDAYEAMLERLKAFVLNSANNPQKLISDSLTSITTCKNPRIKLLTPELLNELSLEQMKTIYTDRFADAGDFTFFIVGNIEESTAKIMAEKYIGSLTNLARKETWIDRKLEGPKGKMVREIELPLEVKKSTVVVKFKAKIKYNPEQNLTLSVLADILNLRYTEKIRENEGGTYGVSVSTSSAKFPKEEKSLSLMFDTDPEKAQHLKSILYHELDKIIAQGPTTEELNKAVMNLQKNREQSKTSNNYWMQALNSYYTYSVNTAAPENYESILKKMTAAQIQQFAKSFLEKADVVDIIFKPKAD